MKHVMLLISLLFAIQSEADDRIFLNATINDQQVNLVLDTGATDNCIFDSVARKLNLKINPPTSRPVGSDRFARTDPVQLKVFGKSVQGALVVIDLPPGAANPDVDGVVGWDPLSQNVCVFDAHAKSARIGVPFPEDAKQWIQLPLRPKARDLRIDLPGPEGKRNFILIDTGADHGVALNHERWKQWQADHPNAPETIDATSNAYHAINVHSVQWASKLSLGPIELSDVPVREADGHEGEREGFEATIGLCGLRRLNLVIDGANEVAYLKPATEAPAPFSYNRLGAVFLPTGNGDELVAHVLKNSPAYKANLRDGDVLLKIQSGDKDPAIDMTQWRVDSRVGRPNRFWDEPAGTKYALTFRRDKDEFTTEVTLEDLLKPK